MSDRTPQPDRDDSAEVGPLPKPSLLSDGWLGRTYQRAQPFEIFFVIGIALAILLPGLWAYSLIDPWETHYAEVARRMLADNDWVHLRWQNESFRSKPVLTFWLIGGSMRALGVGEGGGYSGEFADSALTIFAIRLPFMLFGALGLVMTWSMLARLVNRRVAWLAFGILATTPFYLLVARQAITDMPMVASVMGALSCFILAVHAGDEKLVPFWKKVSAHHVLVGALLLLIGGQLVYFIAYFQRYPKLAETATVVLAIFAVLLVVLLVSTFVALPRIFTGLLVLVWASLRRPGGPITRVLEDQVSPVTTRRQVYMLWFFALVAVSALAKGPPGIGLAGLVCFFYMVFTGHWKLLLKLELPRGIAITILTVVPWHMAMYLKDGRGWFNEYFNHHMFNRFGKGVHGDRGTFDYFAGQLGIGMWPWVALVPAALATVLVTANRKTQEGRVRLMVGIWAIAGVATFCASETKFHHYILPAVPAIAILIAFWLDDFLRGQVKRASLLILAGVPIVALIARDFVGEQKQLIELFIYRYDRPWPSGEPWYVDASSPILWFGLVFCLLLAMLAHYRTRLYGALGMMVAALVFGYWVMNDYMGAAAPHWGQQALHQTYYAQRDIHGVDIQYYGLADLAAEWEGRDSYRVSSLLPDDFAVGIGQTITIYVPGAGIPEDRVSLRGQVSRIGDDEYWIDIPADERAKLDSLIARGKSSSPSGRRPDLQVNADRLIAWQLNWRGENFWSNGEIYGPFEDTRTVFMNTDNKEFLTYIKDPKRANRTFYVITEASRGKGLKSILPTPKGKETLETIDTSCNKFTLLRFNL